MANTLSLTSSQYDVKWEEELRERDTNKIYRISQCGIEGSINDEKTTPSNARIINGVKTTNHRYPWVAVIYFRYKKTDEATSYSGGITSGGTIISNRVIISCRHCVCVSVTNAIENARQEDQKNNEPVGTTTPKWNEATCLPSKEGSKDPPNQNREGHVIRCHIGTSIPLSSEERTTYDSNIKNNIKTYQSRVFQMMIQELFVYK